MMNQDFPPIQSIEGYLLYLVPNIESGKSEVIGSSGKTVDCGEPALKTYFDCRVENETMRDGSGLI